MNKIIIGEKILFVSSSAYSKYKQVIQSLKTGEEQEDVKIQFNVLVELDTMLSNIDDAVVDDALKIIIKTRRLKIKKPKSNKIAIAKRFKDGSVTIAKGNPKVHFMLHWASFSILYIGFMTLVSSTSSSNTQLESIHLANIGIFIIHFSILTYSGFGLIGNLTYDEKKHGKFYPDYLVSNPYLVLLSFIFIINIVLFLIF